MTTSDRTGHERTARALLRDLRHLGQPSARDDAFRRELRASLLVQAHHQTHQNTERMPQVATLHYPHTLSLRRPRRLRTRVACAAAAVLLAVSGLAGYLRTQSATPASAQADAILHRAAAALRLAPGQAAHVTYAVAVDTRALPAANGKAAGGLAGMADVWAQAGASGAPALFAQTLIMSKPGMISRYVQVGSQVYAYNPEMRGDNSIKLDGGTRGYASWLVPGDMLDSARVAQELSTLAQAPQQGVHLLPQQTLDGHAVAVIEVDGTPSRPAQRTIFYVDAQSYVLRGFDAASMDPTYPMPSWQIRLRSYDTVPASAVPAHTFTLNAPATAQVLLPDLGDPVVSQAYFGTPISASCHVSPNVKMLLSHGQSLLAACQASAPGVTADSLVAALVAPYRATLDAAVAAGQIMPAQEASGLAAAQQWFSTMIATPRQAG